MSSLIGGETQYFAVKDIHEDLNLPGVDEYEFLSGYNENDMLKWSQWMQFFLFNKQYDSKEKTKDKLRRAIEYQKRKLPFDSIINNTVRLTVYDIISSNSRLKKMSELLDYVGYNKVKDLNFPITIFAPIDDLFDCVLYYMLNLSYRPTSTLQVLRYHILPFLIYPWQMKDRRLLLTTDLDTQTVESDWTKGKSQLLNPISSTVLPAPYGVGVGPIGDPIPSLPDVWFPKKEWEVNILDYIRCDGGIVYVISRPLVFPDVL